MAIGKSSATDAYASATSTAFWLTFSTVTIIILTFFLFLNTRVRPHAIRESSVIAGVEKRFVKKASEKEKHKPRAELILETAVDSGFRAVSRDQEFIITLPDQITFFSGDDSLRPEIIPPLRRIADLIKRLGLNVEIEGHTDNQPISTGRFPSNWELSVARAVAVLRLFMESGIPPSSASASGRGEYWPIARNDTEEGRERNRRIVLIVNANRKEERAQ